MMKLEKIKQHRIKLFSSFSLFLFFFQSCVEPYDFKSETYEQLLVVEATITNELKFQKVLLSTVYKIDIDSLQPEIDAKVFVTDDLQNTFEFKETKPGEYTSIEKFNALQEHSYYLEIITSSGKTYRSENVTLPENRALLNELYAERSIDRSGISGIAIYSSSNVTLGDINYYRYNYEETYKIVSPYSQVQDLVIDEDTGELVLVPKTKEEKTCYNTKNSKGIIISDTGGITDNVLDKYLIKFIEINDILIRNRYSIKVNQIGISQEAYEFYATLKELSGFESVFSQNQPGYVNGNIRAINDPNENIIGVFHIGNISSKRIFFNFTDFFDLSERSNFLENCRIERPSGDGLYFGIETGRLKFLEEAFNSPEDEEGSGPYRLVPAQCMDCTLLGSNIAPDFWIEQI